MPLFSRGPEHVALLAEMCADDAAARHAGRRTLVTALLAMATTPAPRPAFLAAAATAVTTRVRRLLDAPSPARLARNNAALTALILALAITPPLITG